MNNNRLRCAVVLFVIGFPALLAPSSSWARDDWELWTEFRWKKPLSDRVTLQGVSSARLRDDMGEFYKHFDEIGISDKALPWLKWEGAYHFDYSERPRTQDSLTEHRPYAGLAFSAAWGPLTLENRSRAEYRRFNGSPPDDWRYRNRSKAGFELGRDRWWRMKPFVAEEIFYGFRAGEIGKNRFSVGAEKPLSETFSVELFYVVESNKTGKDWDEFHALGLAANVIF